MIEKKKEIWIQVTSHLTCMKLLRSEDKSRPCKIVAAFSDGDIVLYDNELNVICHTNRQTQDNVIKVLSLSQEESLLF